ncbi:hypothetical protein [Catellatospora sichuanensis]|uniref:hypothetical protein n=1 Tax=Catellatospora sichuanensis TaxID=1969805 RepID=UPI001182DFAA|nr:hypothetical protein [Catellatospora sichuanensis]
MVFRPVRSTSLAAAIGALAIVLPTAACTDRPAPAATPTTVATSRSAPTTPSPAGPRYEAGVVGLCARTDLTPLADLSLKVKRTDPAPPPSGPGEACLFEMATSDGHIASLRVEAVALASVADAERLYRAERAVTRMTPDGPVDGIGEVAEAFTIETEPGFKYSEYKIHARSGNLVVEVWLAVGGKAFTPKPTLAEATAAVAESTLGVVSQAWRVAS